MKIVPLLFVAALLFSCETESDDSQLFDNSAYLLLPQRTLAFQVDSTIYDPATNGTARIENSSRWNLSPLGGDSEESLFAIRIVKDSVVSDVGYLWDWNVRNQTSVNTLNGVSYVGLTSSINSAISWDPLLFANEDQIVTIAGEPIAIHKGNWEANVDSLGTYIMPDGTDLPAIFVTLVESENLIELREWKEVYADGEGLVERRVRILDTQNTDAQIAWEDRAETGFSLTMKRSN